MFGAIAGEITDARKMPAAKRIRTAEVMVAAGDKPGDETQLSATHAALVLRNLFLKPLPEAIRDQPDKLRQYVRIKAEKDGTRITVDVPEIDENLDLARGIARIFRGIPYEREVAANPVEIRPFTKEDRQLAIDARKLKGLLHDQAARAGYVDFLQILPKAINGSLKAKEIAEDEDFSRRLQRYAELSVNLGLEGVPGKPLTSPPDVIFEPRRVEENRKPEKGFVTSNLIAVGCIFCGLLGAWISGRKIRTPEDPSPSAETPAAASCRAPQIQGV